MATALLKRLRPPSLGGRGFGALWLGQSVSELGSAVSFVALPVVAVAVTHASAAQMAVLIVAEALPYVGLSLPSGALADRLPRKILFIAGNACSGLILLTIPAVAAWGRLSFLQLVAAALALSTCQTWTGPAQSALLPALVPPDGLIDANSRMAASTAAAGLVGPGLAGSLVQLVSAPMTMLADAVSYLWCAALALRMHPAAVDRPAARRGMAGEIWEGLLFLLGHPVLRLVALTAGVQQLGGGLLDTLRFLYLLRDLSIPPAAVGAMFSCGAASATAMSLLLPRLARRLGLERLVFLAALAIGIGWSAIPIDAGPLAVKIAILIAGGLVFGCGNTLMNVTWETLGQRETPQSMLGRLRATAVLTSWGPLLIGSVVGGAVGSVAGMRAGTACGALILLLGAAAALPLLRPPRGRTRPGRR